jgi:abnormal spindle-like microcephaly-associated protein
MSKTLDRSSISFNDKENTSFFSSDLFNKENDESILNNRNNIRERNNDSLLIISPPKAIKGQPKLTSDKRKNNNQSNSFIKNNELQVNVSYGQSTKNKAKKAALFREQRSRLSITPVVLTSMDTDNTTNTNTTTSNNNNSETIDMSEGQSSDILKKTKSQKRKQKKKNINTIASTKLMFDNKWADKQEKSFTDWMNFTFSQGYINVNDKSVNDGIDNELTSSIDNTGDGLRTLIQKRAEARIRQQAMSIYHGDIMKPVIANLEQEIAEERIVMRDDRDVHSDLGLQESLMKYLFSYELQWLRLGLEVVFGEIISLPNKSTSIECTSNNKQWKNTIKSFISQRMVANSEISSQFTKNMLIHVKQEKKMKKLLRRHLLVKFLSVILLLDNIRTASGSCILNIPTIFMKNASIKSSKDLLNKFCRDFLKGEGDFLRRLSLIGFTVKFEQTFIDEFDFTVSNLAIDLRDGVRLTRLLELLTKETNSISLSLRVPAVSRLQKLHNVNLVLKKLDDSMTAASSTSEAKDIVDGHRDKTLLLLWKLLYTFELRMLIDPEIVSQEINQINENNTWRKSVYGVEEASNLAVSVPTSVKSMSSKKKFTSLTPVKGSKNSSSDYNSLSDSLLRWVDSISSQYGVPVVNLASCLSDGRALCLLIHYYHPTILPTKLIKKTSNNLINSQSLLFSELDAYTEDDTSKFSQQEMKAAIDGEHRNFNLLRRSCNEIGGIPLFLSGVCDTKNPPEEKTMLIFLGYLFSRLIESSEQVRAAIRIQRLCKSYLKKIDFKSSSETEATIIDDIDEVVEGVVVVSKRRSSIMPVDTSIHTISKRESISSKRESFASISSSVYRDIPICIAISPNQAATIINRKIRSFLQRSWYLSNRIKLQSERLEAEKLYEIQKENSRLMKEQAMLEFNKKIEEHRLIEEEQRLVDEEYDEMIRVKEEEEEHLLVVQQEEATLAMQRQLAIEEEERCLAIQLAEEEEKNRIQQINMIEEARKLEIAMAKAQAETAEQALVEMQARVNAAEQEAKALQDRLELEAVLANEKANELIQIEKQNQLKIQQEKELELKKLRLEEEKIEEIKLKVKEDAIRIQKEQYESQLLVEKEISSKSRAELESYRAAEIVTRELAEKKANELKIEQEQKLKLEEEMKNNLLLEQKKELEMKIMSEKIAQAKAQEELEARLLLEKNALLQELEEVRGHGKQVEADAIRQRIALEENYSNELQRSVNELRAQISESTRLKAEEEKELSNQAIMIEKQEKEKVLQQMITESEGRREAEKKLDMIEDARILKEQQAQQKLKEIEKRNKLMNLSSIIIQSTWRMHSKILLCQRIQHSIVSFQSRVRGSIVRKQQKALELAVFILQSLWKRKCYLRVLTSTNNASTKIKSNWNMRQARLTYKLQLNSIKIMQRMYRSYRLYKNYCKVVNTRKLLHALSSTIIQSKFRMMIQRKSYLNELQLLSEDSARKIANEIKIKEFKSKNVITSFFRMVLIKKHQLEENQIKMKKSVGIISKWFKNSILPFIRIRKLRNGFVRLQAFYHAKKIRNKRSKKIISIHSRIEIANLSAKENPSLQMGKRTQDALVVLQTGKMISKVLKSCQILELSTQLSIRCCETFARANASSILFGLIRSCNRSTPHQELLKHALVVLLNVGRRDHLASIVAEAPEATEVLVDLMQMFRDKSSIFCLACELLCRLVSASDNVKSVVNSSESRKRIDGLLQIMERKKRLDSKVKSLNSGKSTDVATATPLKNKGHELYQIYNEPLMCIQTLANLL